jgi:molecular chaperone HtpG
MYIGEDLNILPDWANFICGVLDCSTLDLVASREAIIRDKPSYKALQDYLAQSVANFIRRLAEIERPTFQKIILQHDWRVIQGGVLNDFFFDEIKDLMPFQSDIGPLTLPKYLERVPNRAGNTKTIYYIPSELPLGQQQSVLFQVRGIPIIRADNFTERFLEKYVKHNKNVNLRQIASGVVELMEPAQEAQWRTLEAHYQQIGIIAKAVRFHPPEIPAIAVRQADYDQNRLIEQIVKGDGQLLDFMEKIGAEKSDVYGLALNVENPLLEQLVSFKGNQKVLNTALRAIYASALLASNVDLTIGLSQTVAYDQMKIIELLLEQAKQIEN